MKITKVMLHSKLLQLFKENAPVRQSGGATGKRGTNLYSPYPGNLKTNGIYMTRDGVRLDLDKVGYIGYANARSKNPRFIEKSIDGFVQFCIELGGRLV